MAHILMNLISILGLLIITVSSFSTDWSTEFDYYTYLDEDELFRLYWNNLDNDMIEFGMEAAATGWIAIGVSPNGQMPSSDIMIGWVDDDGEVYLQDRYTESRTTPLLDPHQNLTLISGEQADGMTRIRFKRAKYTCNENDVQLAQGTTRVIWAFHSTADPTTELFDSSSITYHTNKGSQSLNFNTGVQLPVELEDDIEYVDIVMENVAVPGYQDTTYWCKVFEIPESLQNESRHAVKFAPIVQSGNEAAVHHLLVYTCNDWMLQNESHIGAQGECDHDFENMPVEECRGGNLLYAWAIGGEDLYMPEGVGFPVGGDNGPKYLMMEIHYDNPNLETDIVDSSGYRMYVTQTLRDIEAGFMQVGAWTNINGHFIPPGLSYAHNKGWMSSDCTTAALPPTGINVFGSLLHQHTVGVASSLRIIRDNVELEPIDSNWNYDFNYQNTIIFDETKLIMPGDTLIMDCYYDTSNRDIFTLGGESTSEEMCLAFYLYYPAVDFIGGSIGKREDALAQWMTDAQTEGYLTGNITEASLNWDWDSLSYDTSLDGADEFYNRLWNPEYEQYDQNYAWCGNQDNSNMVWEENMQQPSGFEEYTPDIFTCDDSTTSTTDKPVDDNAIMVNMYMAILMAFVGFVFI